MENFVVYLRLGPCAMDAVFLGRGGVEGLDVEILNIGLIIGEAPSNAFVVADDNKRSAGQSEALDVPTRRGEMDLVPDGRNGQLEMRIVGEQWLAGCGVGAADDPIVAAETAANFTPRIFDPRLQGGPEGGGEAGEGFRRLWRGRGAEICLEHVVRRHVVIVVFVAGDRARMLGTIF